MRGRRAYVGAMLVLLTAVACGRGDGPPPPTYSVEDRAGVEFVWSGPTEFSDELSWRLNLEPEISLGQVVGEDPFLFTGIWDSLLTPTGELVVVEVGSLEVRVFSATGTHLRSFGGRGGGPGEFFTPPIIALVPPDTLIAWDTREFRRTRFLMDGTVIDTETLYSLPTVHGFPRTFNMKVWQTNAAGELLWIGGPPARGQEGVSESRVEPSLVSRNGEEATSLGSFSSAQLSSVRGREGVIVGLSHPFWVRPHFALHPTGRSVAAAVQPEWEIRILGSGGEVMRIIQAPVPRTPIDRQVLDEYRSTLPVEAAMRGLTLEEGEALVSAFEFPDSVPAIGGLIWDSQENLWVGRRSSTTDWFPRRFDVFSPEGRWLSTVDLPDGRHHLLRIGPDFVLAVWYDESDVPFLRRYRIEKPSSR